MVDSLRDENRKRKQPRAVAGDDGLDRIDRSNSQQSDHANHANTNVSRRMRSGSSCRETAGHAPTPDRMKVAPGVGIKQVRIGEFCNGFRCFRWSCVGRALWLPAKQTHPQVPQ